MDAVAYTVHSVLKTVYNEGILVVLIDFYRPCRKNVYTIPKYPFAGINFNRFIDFHFLLFSDLFLFDCNISASITGDHKRIGNPYGICHPQRIDSFKRICSVFFYKCTRIQTQFGFAGNRKKGQQHYSIDQFHTSLSENVKLFRYLEELIILPSFINWFKKSKINQILCQIQILFQ